VLTNLSSRRIECDEISAFCYAKAKNVPEHRDEVGYGDVGTWCAIDSDSKLIPTWLVAEGTRWPRAQNHAHAVAVHFMHTTSAGRTRRSAASTAGPRRAR
jgi:hypothetical protein